MGKPGRSLYHKYIYDDVEKLRAIALACIPKRDKAVRLSEFNAPWLNKDNSWWYKQQELDRSREDGYYYYDERKNWE